jgi:hypothetical protein
LKNENEFENEFEIEFEDMRFSYSFSVSNSFCSARGPQIFVGEYGIYEAQVCCGRDAYFLRASAIIP